MRRILRAMSAEFVLSRQYFVDRRSDFHTEWRVKKIKKRTKLSIAMWCGNANASFSHRQRNEKKFFLILFGVVSYVACRSSLAARCVRSTASHAPGHFCLLLNNYCELCKMVEDFSS